MGRRIDLIVVNWHGHREVVQALSPLRPWRHGRLHVVDNSHSPAEWAALQAVLPPGEDLNLIAAPNNLGFAGGCNLAWQSEAARGADHLLLLNPDARIDEADVVGLADELEADPGAATVCPRIDWDTAGGFTLPVPPSQGTVALWREALAGRLQELWPQRLARMGTRAVERTRRQMASQQPRPIATVSGGVLMVRRAAVDRLPAPHQAPGGALFDPRYFMYFEDTDLAVRLRAAGWRLMMSPRQRAVHGWRHQPHKAPLMAQAQRQYLQHRHPRAWAVSRWALRWLGSGSTRSDPWFWLAPASDAPLASVAAAHDALGLVWALSPSPHLQPALARCNGPAKPLSESEWALVEPGRHAALIAAPGARHHHNPLHPHSATGWVRFDKI